MNLVFYSIRPPKNFSKTKEIFHHVVYFSGEEKILVPKVFSRECINPINFLSLKNKLLFRSICIIDRIYPDKGPVCIIGHINRSGYNFLIGKTPLKSFPTFPDMSNIYNKIQNMNYIVVNTVGPERFKTLKTKPKTTSETVGLLAPVWHYVKVKVFSKNNWGTWKNI